MCCTVRSARRHLCLSQDRGRRHPVVAGLFPVLLLLVAAGTAPLTAQPVTPPPVIEIPRLSAAPRLDDFLDMRPEGAVANEMVRVEGFIQSEPRDGEPLSERTEVYLGYDADNLYVVFLAFDREPDKIRARLTRRENVFLDDNVEIMLDTFNDRRRAYAFLTNPFGIQWDAIWNEGENFDSSFDTLWYSEGRLTAEGYAVWFKIPFRSLRFSSAPEQEWGIILNRAIPRTTENAFWPRISSRLAGRLNQQARATGLRGISPGRNLQFIPYGVFRSWRSIEADSVNGPDWVSDLAEFDGGVDAKVVLKDSLVFDVAVNPDFSQVESDSPQVTVNSRFEVYFPEKRPFFLENADYFGTPINLVFTRRIIDPQFGVRFTGKAGPWAVGALWADDEAPGEMADPDDPEFGKRAQFGIVRVRRDIFHQSSVGFIFTQRTFNGGFNRVGGLDARFKLDDNWMLNMQGVASATERPDGTTAAGPAYQVELSREGRSFDYYLSYDDRSSGYDTQVGYNTRSDIRGIGQNVEYSFRPEGPVLIAWGPEVWVDCSWAHDGTRLDWEFIPELTWELAGKTQFGVGRMFLRSRLRPDEFDSLETDRDYGYGRNYLSFNTNLWPQVGIDADFNWGTGINYVPAEGAEPEVANRMGASLQIILQPNTRLRVDNTYLFSRLTDRASPAAIYNNHIFRSKWNLQFTPEMSLRLIGQYDTTLPSTTLSSLEKTKRFNIDVLFTYMWHPNTALYVGYNSDHENLNLIETRGSRELIRTSDEFINDSRIFFVKFSYMFRL
ncbi:MAG TPA: DUF5916 domain-containing protein [Acidobacteriota bacterium]|jgi:hypothetical protein|nr:carbohydrate binding family 9 domain-containing protein [Acidobacteriota bacterium]HNR38148.1 DUF5916 domain-containing protein [Acidobacteriota bacterium]HNU00683.1 DUF5916 domain-containing protein [Acidobacteriota bacterium]HPB28595.1 DUF5916 domain-containing protein [Acidobacteriota bacterium]HQP74769.1 DUF5916 domain-containing protein [Acidobacteriota bacterium]